MPQNKKKSNQNKPNQNKPSVPLQKRALLGKNWKRRLTLSLLCSLTAPLLLFAGVFEIFAANKDQFDFALGDFLPPMILMCVGLSALLFVATFFWKRRVYDGVFAFVFSLTLAGFLQGTFLNIGVDSLMGDGFGSGVNVGWMMGNTLIWLAVIAGCVAGVFLISRKVRDTVYTVVVIALVMMLGTQGVNILVTGLTTDVTAPPQNPDEEVHYILTQKDIYEVSSKDNVVVFVIDRFDRNYAEYAMKTYPEAFEFLDGFTYYEDYLSLHMRTWPASPTMVTGLDMDFNKETVEQYTERAYRTSPFLNALKQNDYQVKIYVDDYYCYRDAAVFDGVADNLYKTNAEYVVNDPMTLSKRLLNMSLYRVSPMIAKSAFDLSSDSFEGFVEYVAPEDKYVLKDAYLYDKIMEEGVSVQSKDNNFAYIHLAGCHPPYAIDEKGDALTEKWKDNDESASRALRGDLLIIEEYIKGLKAADAYEDATIIIVGDHPSPVGLTPEVYGDNRLPTEPRLTGLFVKRAGESGTPMKKSDAPVAQCNLIPSIIESAGIKTDIDFGEPYWSEDLAEIRVYNHIINHSGKSCDVVRYEVRGDGRNFANWHKTEPVYIGDLYE